MDEAGIHKAIVVYSTEAFTLLGISLTVTALRIYYRARVVRVKRFQVDDYFVLLGALAQILETCLSYASVAYSHGLANNSMSDGHRARLSPDSREYHLRVVGSKIQVAGWLMYICAIWSLKTALCTFYLRLVSGLWKFRRRIVVGLVAIGAGWTVVILTVFLSCRPFYHFWQINPNPGHSCQPAISTAILVTLYVCNIVTDLYLISIPLPILVQSSMRPKVKKGLCFLFCCAIFIIIAASIRLALIMTHPAQSAGLAGPWAVRETFVAVIVTNLPVIFPLFKQWLVPLFRSSRRFLAHPRRSHRSRGEKDIEEQWDDSRLDNSRKPQDHQTLYPIPHTSYTSRGSLEGITGSNSFRKMVRAHRTTPKAFNAALGGSRMDNSTKDKQQGNRSVHSGEDWWREDEYTLNCPESRESDGIIAPLPRCKIRKMVEVSVKESDLTHLSLGNFTSAWGPRRKRPGPDRPVDMRTPYLVDHLHPGSHETEDWEARCMRRLMG